MTFKRVMGLSAALCVFTSCHSSPAPQQPQAVAVVAPLSPTPSPPPSPAPAPAPAPVAAPPAAPPMAPESSAAADPAYAEFRTLLATKSAKEEPSCEAARAQALVGIAREEDLWIAVHCALDALQRVEDYDRVERLLAITSTAHEIHRDWFYQVVPSVNCDVSAGLDAYGVKVLPEDGKEAKLYLGDPVRRADVLARKRCELGSGTYRGTCLPFFKNAGHSDVTLRSLNILNGALPAGQKVSTPAINILTDAAQDPDFFAWTNMAAHAQTPDHDGAPDDTQAAKDAFVKFVNDYIAKAAAACQPDKRDIQASLYWTGFALHAVQDLASHRGRTNPEHAYNAKYERNPDEQQLSVERARVMTTDLLRELMRGKLRQCLPAWRTYAGQQVPFRQKRTDYGLPFEFTPWAVIAYKLSHSKFKHALDTNPTAVRVRWFGNVNDDGTKDDCRWNTLQAGQSPCSQLLARIYQ